MNKQTQAENGCLWGALALLMIPVGNIWRGWVLAKLWAWFIVATFGVQALTVPQAIGISLAINFLTQHSCDCQSPERSTSEAGARLLAITFTGPAIALLMGWIVRGFL